jgi:hypothetical protein
MARIQKIAIKTPKGEVKTAPIGKHHDDLHSKGKRGFIVDGKFTGRTEAAKVAKKSGQATSANVKRLHSHQVKRP